MGGAGAGKAGKTPSGRCGEGRDARAGERRALCICDAANGGMLRRRRLKTADRSLARAHTHILSRARASRSLRRASTRSRPSVRSSRSRRCSGVSGAPYLRFDAALEFGSCARMCEA